MQFLTYCTDASVSSTLTLATGATSKMLKSTLVSLHCLEVRLDCSSLYLLLCHLFVDLDEIWSLLGVSGCPQCTCSNEHLGDLAFHARPRSMKESLRAIRTARAMLQERGNVTAAAAYLRDLRLNLFHTKTWNPFFFLPHCDYECFPQDYLHTM